MEIRKTIISILIITSILSIISNVYASYNRYGEKETEKTLEIKEEYIKNDNIIKNSKVDIEKQDEETYIISVKGEIEKRNNKEEIIYNISQTDNKKYDMSDISVIGASEKINNIKSYWYRKINENENIGKGYIDINNKRVVNREYGTNNNKMEIKENIITNDKALNTIQGSETLKDIKIDITNRVKNILIFLAVANSIASLKYVAQYYFGG